MERTATAEDARKELENAAAKLRRERNIPTAEEAEKLAIKKRKEEDDAEVARVRDLIKATLENEDLLDNVYLGPCNKEGCWSNAWWTKLLGGINLHPYRVVFETSGKKSLFPGLCLVSLVLDPDVKYILGKRVTVPPMADPDTADALKKRSKKE